MLCQDIYSDILFNPRSVGSPLILRENQFAVLITRTHWAKNFSGFSKKHCSSLQIDEHERISSANYRDIVYTSISWHETIWTKGWGKIMKRGTNSIRGNRSSYFMKCQTKGGIHTRGGINEWVGNATSERLSDEEMHLLWSLFQFSFVTLFYKMMVS